MRHITREDVYNIQMALLRNHGYFVREVDVGCNEDPVIQVINDTDRAVITIKVSTDGLNWVISGHRKEHAVLPLGTAAGQSLYHDIHEGW